MFKLRANQSNTHNIMKRTLTLLFAVVLVVACQKGTPEADALQSPNQETAVKGSNSGKSEDKNLEGLNDEPIVYFADKSEFDAFAQINGLEERFAAVDISESLASSKTTIALVRSSLHYPLNYMTLVYNIPQMAINAIFEHSVLHREIVARPDAADAFAKVFAETSIDMSLEKSNYDADFKALSYCNGMFFERLLGSEQVDLGPCKEEIVKIANEKIAIREADSDFSESSIEPLRLIVKKYSK